jgi:flagellar hook assembly protein FlgD
MIFSGFNNDVSWDGNNQQGKSVESGSYVWKLELVDPTGKVFSKSGSLSLIR